MVKTFHLVLGAIPVIIALLISVPLLTKYEIPTSAANSLDVLEIEYTRHHLKKLSYGITERVGAQKTEVLAIKNDGEAKYTVIEQGYMQPDIKLRLEESKLNKIKALIKETGFMSISPESFPVLDNATEYKKSNVKVTLNGRSNQIHWPEQNATGGFIPPIITAVGGELDGIMDGITNRYK